MPFLRGHQVNLLAFASEHRPAFIRLMWMSQWSLRLSRTSVRTRHELKREMTLSGESAGSVELLNFAPAFYVENTVAIFKKKKSKLQLLKETAVVKHSSGGCWLWSRAESRGLAEASALGSTSSLN